MNVAIGRTNPVRHKSYRSGREPSKIDFSKFQKVLFINNPDIKNYFAKNEVR